MGQKAIASMSQSFDFVMISPWLLYLSIMYLELSSNQKNSSAYLNCKVTCSQYTDGIVQEIVIDYLFKN